MKEWTRYRRVTEIPNIMRVMMFRRYAGRALRIPLLIIGALSLQACVYDPYVGAYVPCCTYPAYGYYGAPASEGYGGTLVVRGGWGGGYYRGGYWGNGYRGY